MDSLIKVAFVLWHNTLNQYTHTQYLSDVNFVYTWIFIPLCAYLRLCTYWYHMVCIFSVLPYTSTAMIYTFPKKSDTLDQSGMLKISTASPTLLHTSVGWLTGTETPGGVQDGFQKTNNWF